ncbi:MAG: MerR family transcriptional regulator [Bacteroidales bacterium]|nr:MerR family transcriptional regulator [Bacteroidales bacterium]
MEKLFYSIGEVSELLGASVSLIRYWSNVFERFIKPQRNAKGNRQYTKEDIEVLKQIQFLVKEKGLSLDGAARQLASDRTSVEGRVKALESLKSIREQLVQIKNSL